MPAVIYYTTYMPFVNIWWQS